MTCVTPGNGAEQPHHVHTNARYVYAAVSRRAGGLSLGVDLTPDGRCSFACLYCQADHSLAGPMALAVDIPTLAGELREHLRTASISGYRDLVIAGSGEPSNIPNFTDAIGTILDACTEQNFLSPRRLFTNGMHLDDVAVGSALAHWSEAGCEVWVKMDAADEAFWTINGTKVNVAEHITSLWRFSSRYPVGLQTMLFHSPRTPAPSHIVRTISDAIADGCRRGARIREIHLLTLRRKPSSPKAASILQALTLSELESLGEMMRERTGLTVHVFGP